MGKNDKNNKNTIEVVGPLYFSSSHNKNRHANLLLISNDSGNNHYCLIRNMSRLLSSQINCSHNAKYLCDGCLVYFTSEQKLNDHQMFDCGHVVAKCPTTNLKKNKYGESAPENILKFTNFERKLKVPFVVYADFETIVEPITLDKTDPTNPIFIEAGLDSESSFTVKTHKHHPYSFAYYIKCDFDDTKSMFKSFRGQDAQKVFVNWLENDCKAIFNKFLDRIVPMTPLTIKQETKFRQAKQCYICEKPFNDSDDRVRDHCHLTGAFRGAAHSICNLNFKIPTFIPVFFHNMTGFDSHLFIKELAENDAELDVIAQNKERYISFTKNILVKSNQDQTDNQKKVFLKMRFLDSYRFMASSLDELGINLKPEQCRGVKKYFLVEEEFQLIRQKGVFPYSYVDSFSKLNDTKLPSIDEFYDKLKKRTHQTREL